MVDASVIIRNLRLSMGLKQGNLANLLGVSQAAVSRWENGIDEPSPAIYAKIRDLVEVQSKSQLAIERNIVRSQSGIRVLADIDGMKVMAVTRSFKVLWPEVALLEGQNTADYLIGQSADIYFNGDLMNAIKSGGIKMISCVSDRHMKGFGDNAFRHYWSSIYRKIGNKHYAELSFEACDPEEEVGLRQIIRVDEIK